MSELVQRNHRLTIAYCGAAYQGWQRQANGPSVQETIERALARLWGEPIVLHGSGRTDAGVHALGQVAHFVAAARFRKATALRHALNACLPDDIRILKSCFVPLSFHARFSAVGKEYRYRLLCREVHDPLEVGRAWQLRRSLDLEAMRRAASVLIGKHDFASFASNPGRDIPDTVREIETIHISRRGPRVTLRFVGSGFLYRMVRNLTGTLVRVGDGRLEVEDVSRILAAKRRDAAPPPAPAGGLYLVRVRYSRSGPVMARKEGDGN